MRADFFNELLRQAAVDERIFLLVGDLGYSVVEPFRDRFPQRFVNVGIAEQNMTGIAAGLALSGKTVFTYSIANFPTLRCLEQVRNDVCYHNANVKIVSVGGGLAYGSLGFSHHGTEDLAIMRAMPNLKVFAPADPVEAAWVARTIATVEGPCYLRLGKSGEPAIHTAVPAFEIGVPAQLKTGADAAILAIGSVARNALLAAQQLEQEGCAVGVYSVHTLKPFSLDWVSHLLDRTREIVTVEEHTHEGGLGSVIAEIVAARADRKARLTRISLPDSFRKMAGNQDFLGKDCLSVEAISKTLRAVLGLPLLKEDHGTK